jgi:hypothetical protein
LASFLNPWGRRPRLRRTPWSGLPNLPLNPPDRHPLTRKLALFLQSPISPRMSTPRIAPRSAGPADSGPARRPGGACFSRSQRRKASTPSSRL